MDNIYMAKQLLPGQEIVTATQRRLKAQQAGELAEPDQRTFDGGEATCLHHQCPVTLISFDRLDSTDATTAAATTSTSSAGANSRLFERLPVPASLAVFSRPDQNSCAHSKREQVCLFQSVQLFFATNVIALLGRPACEAHAKDT